MDSRGSPATFPLGEFLLLVVEVVSAGRAGAVLEVDSRHLNPHGVVHGGVLFTMVDTAMGAATMSLVAADELCASTEVRIRFLRPVRVGRLEASAEVTHRSGRTVDLESRVKNDGKLVATSTGSFAVIKPTSRG